jgi:hypothetical protein
MLAMRLWPCGPGCRKEVWRWGSYARLPYREIIPNLELEAPTEQAESSVAETARAA